MKLKHLKRGLFGYRKASVFRCIAELQEEASAKLLETDTQLELKEAQYNLRIEQLEARLHMCITMGLRPERPEDAPENTAGDAADASCGPFIDRIQQIEASLRRLSADMAAACPPADTGQTAVDESKLDRNMSLFQRKSEMIISDIEGEDA